MKWVAFRFLFWQHDKIPYFCQFFDIIWQDFIEMGSIRISLLVAVQLLTTGKLSFLHQSTVKKEMLPGHQSKPGFLLAQDIVTVDWNFHFLLHHILYDIDQGPSILKTGRQGCWKPSFQIYQKFVSFPRLWIGCKECSIVHFHPCNSMQKNTRIVVTCS